MSLGAWILFWSEAGNAPPVVPPAIGLFVVLYVSGCAFSDTLDAPSFAGLVATDPSGTVARGSEVPAPNMTATAWVMAPFTQPAVGSPVTVTIDDTTWPAAWLGNTPELPIFIACGGWYTLTAVDTVAKTIAVTNLGKAGAIVSVSC